MQPLVLDEHPQGSSGTILALWRVARSPRRGALASGPQIGAQLVPKNPYRNIDYFCTHVMYESLRSEYVATFSATSSRFRPSNYHRSTQFSADPNVIYEEIVEENGMWLSSLPEWMKEAATLF